MFDSDKIETKEQVTEWVETLIEKGEKPAVVRNKIYKRFENRGVLRNHGFKKVNELVE